MTPRPADDDGLTADGGRRGERSKGESGRGEDREPLTVKKFLTAHFENDRPIETSVGSLPEKIV